MKKTDESLNRSGKSKLSRKNRRTPAAARAVKWNSVMHKDSFNRMMTYGLLLLSTAVLSGCEALAIPDTSSLLLPRFSKSEVFGFVAGFGTTFAAVPDLIRMFRRRSSRGVNPTMAGIIGAFQILWIYYGLLIVSRPVIAWNLVGVMINSLTVWAYLRFARIDADRARR